MNIVLRKVVKSTYMDILRITALIGLVLAVAVSWEANHSTLWAWLHGFLGWIYVFYHFENWLLFSVFLSGYVIMVKKTITNIAMMVKVSRHMMGGG